MITYARGNGPWPWDTAWDQRAKMLSVFAGGGGSGPPPLGAAPEIYQGTFNDPNGNIIPNVPTQPARYSQLASSGGSGEEFHWQPDTGVWI